MENKNNFTVEKAAQFSPILLDAVRDLTSQLESNSQPLSENEFKSLLSSDHTHLFIAKKNEAEIVGMCTLVIYRIPYKKKGWIEDVVVDRNYRAMGIGTIMLKNVIQFARNQGVSSLNLTSRPTREIANKLYNSLGFNKVETNVYRMIMP